jgi:hypothetical protein
LIQDNGEILEIRADQPSGHGKFASGNDAEDEVNKLDPQQAAESIAASNRVSSSHK